ncbi:MAG: response regulator transcription factor [Bacteroidetes bacterium]|nr:MAG: response regulator transcription factor [Bacteroidota bacterium]
MSKRILVADDEALITKTIKFRLQREGYEILTASDGKEAMELLDKEHVDLVVTDLLMPVHSGLEIIQKVKGTMQQKIPVIVLSAAGLEKNVVEAFNIGADDFVTKPFSPEELSLRIKKLL